MGCHHEPLVHQSVALTFRSSGMKIIVLLMVVAFATVEMGCKRRSKVSASPASPTNPETAATTDQSATPSTPAAEAPQVDAGAAEAARMAQVMVARAAQEDVQFLTKVLREFVAERQRMPKDVDELQNVKVDSRRSPPPGKRFVLDPVNRAVRLE